MADPAAMSAAKGPDVAPAHSEAEGNSTGGSMTSLKAVMVGAGLHAAIIADAVQGLGYDFVGATDPSRPLGTEVLPGLKVIGTDDMLPDLIRQGVRAAFIGVGGATENRIRRKVYEKLVTLGFFLPHAVSPAARLGIGAVLGPATYVMPGAVVGPRSRIGANVVINTGSIVSHDAVIQDHAHITPGAVLAGSVMIGEGTTVGMAATVLFGTKVGKGSLIHNNASVIGGVGDNLEFTREGRRVPRR
jgi:sugar O-acyltransferase (sialic acid O-acetyltransferase NeuD family)